MVFVFDMDDTLCETDEFSRQWILRFFEERGLPIRQICESPRFADAYFDWTFEEAVAWFKEFGDEMMENFPLKEGARKVLTFLHNNGHKILIATAREKNWHSEPEKVSIAWLKKNSLPFDKIFIGREDKEKICEEEQADVFVDDDIGNVERVARLFEGTSKLVFLSTTKFNQNLPTPTGAIRITSLAEILAHLPQ